MKCYHCGEQLIEVSRNEMYVFYACNCHKYKNVKWDWAHFLLNGKEYELGDAFSFILECPNCRQIQYRQSVTGHETCLYCPGLIPVHMVEVEHET